LYVSLNEIDATVKRASRGIGLSWGLAEETGKAARWLAAHRIVGPDIVLSALETHAGRSIASMAPFEERGAWQARGGVLSPLLAGARFSDEAGVIGSTGLLLASVIYPVLLLPWVAWTAKDTNHAFEVSWPDAQIRVFPRGLDMARRGVAAYGQADVKIASIAAALPSDTLREHRFGIDVEPATWSLLQQFAHLSFVPASERSRLTGAGYGLTDDD
jgi:hypothetical protein